LTIINLTGQTQNIEILNEKRVSKPGILPPGKHRMTEPDYPARDDLRSPVMAFSAALLISDA
jgi:hypothetical protein